MQLCRILLYSALTTISLPAIAQDSSSSSAPKHTKKPPSQIESTLDSGSISNSVYHNKTLALACKIPEGWVLRTEEMNATAVTGCEERRPRSRSTPSLRRKSPAGSLLPPARSPRRRRELLHPRRRRAHCLLPRTERCRAIFRPAHRSGQGPGFHHRRRSLRNCRRCEKSDPRRLSQRCGHPRHAPIHASPDLSHGYAVSITIIAGTEDDVEELIDGLSFSPHGK